MKFSGLVFIISISLFFSLIAFGNMPKYKIDPDKCIGCTLCVNSCSVQAIEMIDGKAVIDTEKCIGCGICADGDKINYTGCPTSAIDKEIPATEDSEIKETALKDSLEKNNYVPACGKKIPCSKAPAGKK